MATLSDAIRRFSKQDIRRALVAGSLPARVAPIPVARPLGSTPMTSAEMYEKRESGAFQAQPVRYGAPMKERRYDLESSVLSFEDSECTFRNMHAIDGNRRVLYQREYPFGNLPVALKRLEPIEAEYDSVTYLSNTWVNNYYHWLMLVLPMIRHYRAAGVDIEKLYVGRPLNDWQRRTFEYADLSPDNVITKPCRAKTGNVAVLTRHVGGVSPEQIHWARSLFVPEEPSPGTRKLFVGRGEVQTRRLIDEEKFAEALEREFGFEYILTTGMSFDDEIALFGQAGSIVAPYGAALANILFCPTSTKVLELTAYEHDFRLAHCYQEMGAAIGMPFATMRGLPTPRRKDGSYTHIRMGLDSVLREVEKMLSTDAE